MCNARIYIGNIPASCPKEFLENIGNTVGEVTGVTFLKSKLCSGRHAGFMNMTSEAQALAAVARLGATVFDGTPLYAKLQSAFPLQRVKSRGAEKPCFAVKPRDANKPAATIDGDGFVTPGSKHRAASVIDDRPKLRTITSWASLFIDDVSVAETAAAEQVEAAAVGQVEAKQVGQVEAKQVEAAVGQVEAKQVEAKQVEAKQVEAAFGQVEAKQVEAAAAGQVEAVAVAEAVHHDDTEMEAMRQHRVGLHTVTQRDEGLLTQILNKHIDELILDLIKEMPSLKPVAQLSPDSVLGAWNDPSRSFLMREDLAVDHDFEEQTRRIIKKTTPAKGAKPNDWERYPGEAEDWEPYGIEDFYIDRY